MSKNYNYTTGNAFTFNGSDYTGYYHYDNGVIRSKREDTVLSVDLSAQSTILGQYLKDGHLFSYLPTGKVELLHDYNDLKFSSNEIINKNAFYPRFDKIMNNFFEIYRCCFPVNNKLPTGYTRYSYLSANDDTLMHWETGGTVGVTGYPLTQINANLDNIIQIKLIKSNLSEYTIVVVLCIHSFHLFKISTDDTSTFEYLGGSTTTGKNGNVSFSKISTCTVTDEGILFISDSVNKQIYKIDIRPAVFSSRVNTNNPTLLDVTTETVSSTSLAYYNNELYAYDKDSKKIRVYNESMSVSRSYSNSKFFGANIPVSMSIDSTTDTIYILCDTGKLFTFNTNLTGNYSSSTLDITLSGTEQFSNIFFSKNNSNIVYVTTTHNVYKSYNTGLPKTVGKFVWSIEDIQPPLNFLIDTISTENNYDLILGYADSKFYLFNESNILLSSLEKSNFKIFTKEDIQFKDIFFNNVTFNQAINKILHNHDVLVSYLQSKFIYGYVDETLVLSGAEVFNPAYISNIFEAKDYKYFAGVNEELTPQVFNRVLQNIINYQNNICDLINVKVLNYKYPHSEVVTF